MATRVCHVGVFLNPWGVLHENQPCIKPYNDHRDNDQPYTKTSPKRASVLKSRG